MKELDRICALLGNLGGSEEDLKKRILSDPLVFSLCKIIVDQDERISRHDDKISVLHWKTDKTIELTIGMKEFDKSL